jgi:hypothetical protein
MAGSKDWTFPSFPRVLKTAGPRRDWLQGDVTERIALMVDGKSAIAAQPLGVTRCRDAACSTRFQGFARSWKRVLTRLTHDTDCCGCCGEWLGMISVVFQDDVLGRESLMVLLCPRQGDVYNPPGVR